jgi:3-hydroxyacyl-CoA dehydrogenase
MRNGVSQAFRVSFPPRRTCYDQPFMSIERIGAIALSTVDAPPVNALHRAAADQLRRDVEDFESDSAFRAMVITGAGKFFIAGADLREIERITQSSQQPDMSYLNELLSSIENCAKPIVMAVNGPALGIGLETAMAGHYRILASTAHVALPEVKLGLIPGAGGTQRLPRLIGRDAALRMMLTGEPVPAAEAFELGLADEICEGNVRARALAVAAECPPVRRTSDLEAGKPADWTAAELLASACWPGREAPLSILKAVQAGADFETGLAREAELFRERLLSEEARNLVSQFFAGRAARREANS